VAKRAQQDNKEG
jgi:hypothetical protein